MNMEHITATLAAKAVLATIENAPGGVRYIQERVPSPLSLSIKDLRMSMLASSVSMLFTDALYFDDDGCAQHNVPEEPVLLLQHKMALLQNLDAVYALAQELYPAVFDHPEEIGPELFAELHAKLQEVEKTIYEDSEVSRVYVIPDDDNVEDE